MDESSDSHSLLSLNKKLVDYSQFPLTHWQKERVGRTGLTVLAIYGDFPKNSKFSEPKHIPIDAQWGRFRLASKVRLIGFTIPKNLDGLEVKEGKQSFLLDSNTFYIVFLDKDHQFYCTEKK